MLTFKEFALADKHQHDTFDKLYACYMACLGRASRYGSGAAKQTKITIEEGRQVYREMQAEGTASQAQGCATKIVRCAIDQHTDGKNR